MRRQEVSHLGFLGAETPKPIYISKLISGFHKSGFHEWRVQGDFPLGIQGTEMPKH
jgi:hypothetical protein